MGIDVKDLIEGKVYSTISANENNGLIIFRSEKNHNTSSCHYTSFLNTTSKKIFFNYTFSTFTALQNIREATQDEIEWLEACEKAKKYVDKPVKQKFIVGRWYKINDCWYAKFEKLIDNYFHLTELINLDGYIKDSSYTQITVPFVLLEDLSEIQQYLPDNHVDKFEIMEFKKDDYIVITKDEKSHYNGKLNHCYKLLDDCGQISDHNRIPLDNFSGKEARYATKEEIEHYNKIGKPYDVTTLVKSEYLNPEDLIEGCWYILKYKGSFKALFKFKGIKNDSLLYQGNYYNYNIDRLFTNNSVGSCKLYNIETIIQASNEEVLKYFPDEKFVMSFEEALIECKRRYPIGTKFHPVNRNYPNGDIYQTFKVEGNNFLEFKNSSYESKQAIKEGVTPGILWYNGVFAEIVKEDTWIPKVGDYVIMENAGGWGYDPINNGCLAVVTRVDNVSKITTGLDKIVYGVGGVILNPKNKDTKFYNVPIIDREGIVVRKAEPHELIENNSIELKSGDYTKSVLLDQSNSGYNRWEEVPLVIQINFRVNKASKPNKLEIHIDPITPIKVEPIVELKIKKVSKITI